MIAQTKICLFRPELQDITLKDFLKKDLGISAQFIKKFKLSRSYLEKSFSHQSEISVPLDILNKGMVNPSYSGPKLDILYEDEEFLALNKPSGLHLHPFYYTEQSNLLSFLRKIGKKSILNIATETHEKGWLYRLDRETSGVVVAAKNRLVYELYRKKFSQLVSLKRYICLVSGDCNLDGHYRLFYRSHAKKGALIQVSDQASFGKGGDFVIRKLYSNDKCHLLQVDLKTGLRHQIRAGLQYLGCPIIGDTLYGQENASRLMLHAYQYRLQRQEKEELIITSSSFDGFDSFLDLDSLLEVLHKKSLVC